LAALERDVETANAEVDKPFRRAEELEQKRQKLREIQRSIEELYDQNPGRDVRKLASRLETLKPVMTFVQGGAYDIAEIRQSMADVATNKAAFDRWLLALQNSGIVHLHEHDDIVRRGDPEAYVHDHKTGRYYSDLMMKQGWEPKAASVPPITAFIEAEAQTEGHINDYGLEEIAMLELARSADLAQQAYGELYVEQQAQVNPTSGLHLGSGLAEQGGSNENTVQSRGATTEALMAALQTIANIEAPDPSGNRSLKELSDAVGHIARAAIANAGGAEAIQDKGVGAALGKIAGIMASNQQGRLLSLQERIGDAANIARATIAEIESRMVAQSVMVNAAEMAQPRQPSTHGQGIGW
ncbi:MAG TPA: hypothetical protein VI260_26685, partial [Blastocatellia bacterium]